MITDIFLSVVIFASVLNAAPTESDSVANNFARAAHQKLLEKFRQRRAYESCEQHSRNIDLQPSGCRKRTLSIPFCKGELRSRSFYKRIEVNSSATVELTSECDCCIPVIVHTRSETFYCGSDYHEVQILVPNELECRKVYPTDDNIRPYHWIDTYDLCDE